MAIAAGSTRRVAIIEEVTAGTTPTSPAFQILRTTTAGLLVARPKIASAERRADGNVAQVYKGNGGASANINFEWSDDVGIDLLLESQFRSTFNSSGVMKNGITPTSITLETTDETGGTDTYERGTGMQVNTTTINFTPGQAVTSTMNLLGMSGDDGTAILSGATYTAAGTEKVFCGFDFTMTDFFSVSSPKVQSLTLNLNSQLRQQYAISAGTPYPIGIGLGQLLVTGEAMVYAESDALTALKYADTQADLQFTFGVDTNKKYTIDMLTVAVTEVELVDGGNTGDVMGRVAFQALYDTGDACAIKITRNVA